MSAIAPSTSVRRRRQVGISRWQVLDFFRKQGAKGGKIGGSAGGKKAAETMTAEQRRARALKAVAAREAKRKKNQTAKTSRGAR